MARKKKMDFTDVESFVKCSEGEHVAVLKEVEEKTTQNGDDMLKCRFLVTKGESTGAIVFENFVLTQKALWKFKSYLEVVGIKADKKIIVDIDKLIGRACIIKVIHEEYNGKINAKVDAYKKLKAVKESVEDEEFEDEWADE